MGYHSTVEIIADKKVSQMLEEVIKRHEHVQVEVLKDKKNECTKFSIDWIKWYTLPNSNSKDQPFAVDVEHVLEKADEMDLSYSFLRVGEDTEDIEFRHNFSDGTPIESCYPTTFLENGDLSFERKDKALSYEEKEYVCDKLCKHCHILEQEELNKVCETCPLNEW